MHNGYHGYHVPNTNSDHNNNSKIPSKSVPSYVSVRLDNRYIHCLVDTGAAYSLCSKSIIPQDAVINDSPIKLKGVTGTPLHVVGSTIIILNFNGETVSVNFIVVSHIDNDIILGRDFLAEHECNISFKNLTLTVNNTKIPMIKPCRIPHTHSLNVGRTLVIPPKSVSLVRCNMSFMLTPKQKRRKYLSATGIFVPRNSIHHGNLTSGSGFYNSSKGIVNVMFHNNSCNSVEISRGTHVGTFDTVSSDFVNSLNNCYRLHSRSIVSKDSDIVNTVNIDDKQRWTGNNIENLYNALNLHNIEHLNQEQLEQAKALISDYRNIFSENDQDIGSTDLMQQTIILDTQIPIRAKYRNIPLAHREAAEREIKQLLDLGVIQLSESPYHSPSFLMKKPNGSFRVLTDFRLLNKHVIRSFAKVPSLESMSACWKGCKYFSKMDFIKGFYQCNLAPECTKYTATCIPGVAFFEYLKSPLGLSSSPGFFQSLVEKMMMGLKGSVCVCYLDDILSGSTTFEGMLSNLRQIFERISHSKMLLSPKKVELFKLELKFLGIRLSEKGLSVCPDKLEAIDKMLPPKNAKGIKSFLGMTGFFRRWIKSYAQIAAPLTSLLKKDAPFNWGKEQQNAWVSLKKKLTECPTLLHPDVNKTFTLMTDSSDYAIGAILCQNDSQGKLHPVSFASKVLTSAEQNWSIVQKELFSLKFFIEKFKSYLLNQEFEVLVDNSALLHLDSFKHSDNKRLWRWFEVLQNYKFNVTLKPSKQNPSDGPSRLVRSNDPNLQCLPERAEVRVNVVTEENPKILNISNQLVPYNDETIKQAQQQDPVINMTMKWVTDNKRPDSSIGLAPDEKTYYNSFKRLSIVDGLLYRSWESTTNHNQTQLLCIPQALQENIIDICHTIPMSAHYGKEKTVKKLTSRFYFPKLQQKVDLFINNCHLCLKKATNHKHPKAPLKPFVTSYPNEVLQIDILESLPSSNGYHAILTMTDRFTLYAEAVPLRNTKVETICRAVLNHYITRHGIPTAIHSDRGANIHSADLIQALYKLMGIEKTASSAYRPQGHGGIERFNRTLKDLLWAFCQENPRNWLYTLDQVLFAYRTTVHSTTGYSPFFLRYGVHPRLPVDIITGSHPPDIVKSSQSQFARDLYYKLHQVYAFVRNHTRTKQISMKKQHDRNSHVVEYKPQDWVYVWKPAPKDCDFRKFYDHFRGPCQIDSKITEYTYKILLPNGKHDIVHMDKLRLAKTPNVITPPIVPSNQQTADNNYGNAADRSLIIIHNPTPVNVRHSSRPRIGVERLNYDQGFRQLNH